MCVVPWSSRSIITQLSGEKRQQWDQGQQPRKGVEASSQLVGALEWEKELVFVVVGHHVGRGPDLGRMILQMGGSSCNSWQHAFLFTEWKLLDTSYFFLTVLGTFTRGTYTLPNMWEGTAVNTNKLDSVITFQEVSCNSSSVERRLEEYMNYHYLNTNCSFRGALGFKTKWIGWLYSYFHQHCHLQYRGLASQPFGYN